MLKIKKVLSFLFKLLTKFFKFLKKIIIKINSKKLYSVPFYAIVAYFLLVIILIQVSGDTKYSKVLPNKRVNDITTINPIYVNKEIQPQKVSDIVDAINTSTGPISIGGGRFSMGGQIGFENSLHIDMRQFNKVLSVDRQKKRVTVQPGITWRDLQKTIDPYHLSVKIMQTYANFTVGGSISVNCHGRYIGHGPIISSVLELKIVTANGSILTCNRNENYEIFKAVAGGYGGIGVIVEATLQLEDNVKVERKTNLVKVDQYIDFFNENVRGNKNVIFQNGDLYPPNYDMVNNVAWIVSDKELTDTTHVTPENENYWLYPKLVELVSWGDFGKWIRRKIIDPLYYSSEQVVWRNKEASYDVRELEPSSRAEETYVLQEYFIPINHITSFIPKMKAVYDKYDVNIINVSLRHAYPDKESYLTWASEEVFAFVIYYQQGTDASSKEVVKQWTVEMTDAILSENGTWYLPYQPHATIAQFNQAFPHANIYFDLKNQLDSNHRFTNQLLDKYNPYVQQRIEKERANIKGYYRDEGQSILTVPEWYLVFNPKEYADFLEAGKNPSDFPYYASIDEYWKLYDRSLKLVSEAYPNNDEYTTMLQVIGVSITMEYTFKLLYENTYGKLFSWLANGTFSDEEKKIFEAHRAYSDFIYHTAWYEFEFMPWIQKVWSTSNTAESNWLRKVERKLFFTIEFMFKAAYAQLIEWGAKASYEAPETNIYLLVSGNEPIQSSETVQVLTTQDSLQIIGIQRWGAFTTTLLDLCEKDIIIHEISGNHHIVLSILMDYDESIKYDQAELLYRSEMVTNKNMIRLVYLLPVEELIPFMKNLKSNDIELEHIYDY